VVPARLRDPRAGQPLKVLGVYDETYRRVDGTWRMSSMTLRFEWGENVGHVTPDNPMRILPRAEG
jgi:hypothetical protein